LNDLNCFLRIGFRYVKGIGEEKGNIILKAREKGPFESLHDFAERTGIDRESMQNLVAVGAFDAIRRSRRQLLWEVGTIKAAGLAGMAYGEQEGLPIPEMSPAEETVTDYTFQGFSAARHIMKLYREKLDRLKALTSKELILCKSGETVLIGGYRVCLQMPPTAKGFAFITLEDEEGLMNVVVRPGCYHTYRMPIRLEPILLVEGIVEKKDGLINVKAEKIVSLKEEMEP
jgi:error-prone DNA polymerase